MSSKPAFLDIFKRPEVVTLIVAVVVSLAAYFGLPARAGLDVPPDALTHVVGAFWAVFVGAVFEGQFKGADYTGGFRELLGSKKFRGALATIGVLVVYAGLQPFQVTIPEEALTLVVDFIIAAILGKGFVDGNVTALARAAPR